MSLYDRLQGILSMYGTGYNRYYIVVHLIEKMQNSNIINYYTSNKRSAAYASVNQRLTVERKNWQGEYINSEILAQHVLPNDRLLVEK